MLNNKNTLTSFVSF